jgi:uncharacterized protein DUF4304
MGSADLNTVFKTMVSTVAARLSVRGFAKRGAVLHKSAGNNVALVEFQRSLDSTKERIVFTVNLGVICGDLSDERVSGKLSAMHAHWRERLGFLRPDRDDKWWEITAKTNVIALANELSAAIEELALPYLDKYLDSRALVALWESGKSPGITAGQRARLLEQLRNAQ